MRWLFVACASAIAAVYYMGISQDTKTMEKLNTQLASTIYALAGRGTDGNYIETTIEEVEEETPYYFPPGQPKEEKDVVYG